MKIITRSGKYLIINEDDMTWIVDLHIAINSMGQGDDIIGIILSDTNLVTKSYPIIRNTSTGSAVMNVVLGIVKEMTEPKVKGE